MTKPEAMMHDQVPTERITKIGAAERQLVTAIDLFFNGGDTIAVYALAGAAREIITTMCEHRGITSFFDDALDANPDLTEAALRRMANRYRGFLKHADRDPDTVLEDFTDYENDHILFIACHDLGRLCGGMPVEAQVFEAWYLACHPEKVRADSDVDVAALFPGVRAMDRQGGKRQGLAALRWAKKQADLKMAYSVE
jgi:hypothetical protein